MIEVEVSRTYDGVSAETCPAMSFEFSGVHLAKDPKLESALLHQSVSVKDEEDVKNITNETNVSTAASCGTATPPSQDSAETLGIKEQNYLEDLALGFDELCLSAHDPVGETQASKSLSKGEFHKETPLILKNSPASQKDYIEDDYEYAIFTQELIKSLWLLLYYAPPTIAFFFTLLLLTIPFFCSLLILLVSASPVLSLFPAISCTMIPIVLPFYKTSKGLLRHKNFIIAISLFLMPIIWMICISLVAFSILCQMFIVPFLLLTLPILLILSLPSIVILTLINLFYGYSKAAENMFFKGFIAIAYKATVNFVLGSLFLLYFSAASQRIITATRRIIFGVAKASFSALAYLLTPSFLRKSRAPNSAL